MTPFSVIQEPDININILLRVVPPSKHPVYFPFLAELKKI